MYLSSHNFCSQSSEIKRSNPVDGMHFFNLHEIRVTFFHEISPILNYSIVCYLQDLKNHKMPVMWKFSEDARKIVENVYTF